MSRERFEQLIILKLSQQATTEEEAELEVMVALNAEYKEYLESLDALQASKTAKPSAHDTGEKFQQLWQRIAEVPVQHIPATKAKRSSFFILKVAASISLLWMVSYFAYHYYNKSLTAIYIEAPLGETYTFSLPDGSKVKLNAGSSLHYSKTFLTDSTRQVWLSGEAYFDVQGKASWPFRVITDRFFINVLGTCFTVKAYDNEPLSEATLISGKIKVGLHGEKEQRILKPYQKLVSNKGAGKRFWIENLKESSQALPLIKETAWMIGTILFEEEPLDEIARKLERHYNVTIVFEDENIKKQKISGLFKKESLAEALAILQQTTPMEYEIKGGKVFLKSTTIY